MIILGLDLSNTATLAFVIGGVLAAVAAALLTVYLFTRDAVVRASREELAAALGALQPTLTASTLVVEGTHDSTKQWAYKPSTLPVVAKTLAQLVKPNARILLTVTCDGTGPWAQDGGLRPDGQLAFKYWASNGAFLPCTKVPFATL